MPFEAAIGLCTTESVAEAHLFVSLGNEKLIERNLFKRLLFYIHAYFVSNGAVDLEATLNGCSTFSRAALLAP